MCGIAGILRLDQKLYNEHVILLNNLSHRGPDGGDHFVDKNHNFSIVHSRLSIIDLTGGKQPMTNSDRSLYITYNGELYNYKNLKNELTSLGYSFSTNSDTEVVLISYHHWGKECLKKFRGMFAFSIVDYRKQIFFIARDHFGIKPLYYYLNNKVLVFSSELHGIRRLALDFTFDLDAIDAYLNLQYIPGIQTAYKQVRKLAPAHSLQVSFDLKQSKIESYWNFQYSNNRNLGKSEWVDRVESVIEESVKSHLISDVPFGAFLSGGIDSSLVVSKMSKILNQPVKTFTIGFKNERFSELKYAEAVAKKLGTEHYTEIIEPDALQILPTLVKHYGEPFGDSSCIPT
jgi:asparagine synthase (glutamine-hydrolysing)